MAWIAVIILSGFAALAQSSSPATAPTTSDQAKSADLPDTQPSLTSQTPASPPVLQRNVPEHPPANETPSGPVTILEDTLIRVMTNEPLNSKRAERGTPVWFTVSEDVVVGDMLAIPRGATVHGEVIQSKKAGVLTGSPELTLKLVSLNLGGRSYPLDSYQFKVKGTSKTKPTETKAIRGAYVGALVRSISNPRMGSTVEGRAASMGTDAAVGAGLGTLASAAMPGPGIRIPSEAQVDFYLAAPVTVTPVSAKEAARLAQGLHPGGPSLYVRGDTP
jgi:hypothetical protein